MWRRAVIRILFIILSSFLLLDFLLWQVDPLGIRRIFADGFILSHAELPAAAGFVYTPGYYDLTRYDVHIGLDGLRVVPDSAYADCIIAVLGDSITFGMGVNDDETYVNHLARAVPVAHWRNAGMPAYSAANIERQIEAIPADGYIWLIIYNDDVPAIDYGHHIPLMLNATALYLEWLTYPPLPPADVAAFRRHADGVLARSDVLAFALDNPRLIPDIVQVYPAIPLIASDPALRVSPADPHPNAIAHRRIAEVMVSVARPFVERICG